MIISPQEFRLIPQYAEASFFVIIAPEKLMP